MAPKLYMTPTSPPVRAVLMCAKALTLELELVHVNIFEDENLKDDFLKKNPQHTIPVLEDDDGFILSDSHAIMGYLVAKYGKNDALCPKNDYKQRAIIDHRLHFDSSILCIRGLAISKPLIYLNIQPTKEKLEAVKEALQILDRMIAQNKTDYITGNTLSIADFSFFTSINFVNNMVPYSSFPNIVNYVKKIEKLPYSEVDKEGAAILEALFSSKLIK